eukprot:g270.t1
MEKRQLVMSGEGTNGERRGGGGASPKNIAPFELKVVRSDGNVQRIKIPCSSFACDQGLPQRVALEMKHLYRTLPIYLFHIFYLFFIVTTIFRNYAYSKHRPGELLWDLGYELLPSPESAPWISEKILLTSIVCGMSIIILTPLLSARPHSMNVGANKVVVEAFTMTSVGHTLRFFTYAVTGLPGPAYHCRPGEPDSVFEGSIFSLSNPDKHNCGDLIFSGHMLFVLMMACTVTHYRKEYFERRWLRVLVVYFMWLIAALQAMFIIMARNHYSVDVVVALYVSPMLWLTMQNVFASQWFQKHCSWYIAWYKYDYDSGSGKCDRVLVMFWSLTQICSKYGIRVSRSQRMRTESDLDFESDPLVENV